MVYNHDKRGEFSSIIYPRSLIKEDNTVLGKMLISVVIVLALAAFCTAESSSTSYTLEQSVMGSAGGSASSSSYSLGSTLGQSTPIGVSSSASYTLQAGFWYQKTSLPGDVNSDCKVNVLDLIFIRNNLNKNPASDPNAALSDVNGDGKVNVLDLIMVRNLLNTQC